MEYHNYLNMKNEEIKQVYESMLVEDDLTKKNILAGLDKISIDAKKQAEREEEIKKQTVDAIDSISVAMNAYELLLKNEGNTIRKILLKLDKQADKDFFENDLDERFYYGVSGFSQNYGDFVRDLEINFN